MYDIGIVGAGPAGATLARLLADQYRVLLLNSGIPKCCGGLLHPRAQSALVQCALVLPEQVRVSPQPTAVTVLDWNNRLVQTYGRRYINVDRACFDRWLLSLVPPTVDVRNNAVYQKSESHSEGLTLHFRENDEPQTAQVRRLVGADGAFSNVRREFFPNVSMPKRYIAVQHWFEHDALSVDPKFGIDLWNAYLGIFDSTLTDSYLWAIPKFPQWILGGAFPLGTNVSPVMQTIRERLESQGLRLGTPIKREAGQLLRPLRFSSIYLGDARTILVGEAAGLISPSTAEGISDALYSAYYLAEALQRPVFDPSFYRRLLRKQLWRLWRVRFKIPFMFNPAIRKYVIRSTLMAQRQ